MIRVEQTLVVEQIDGVPGNCLQAAVASLLDLPIEAVPHFVLFADWPEALRTWLLDRDLVWGRMAADAIPTSRAYLAFGSSPRGYGHVVVCIGGQTVWDPHPSRDGLVSVDEVWDIRSAAAGAGSAS